MPLHLQVRPQCLVLPMRVGNLPGSEDSIGKLIVALDFAFFECYVRSPY